MAEPVPIAEFRKLCEQRELCALDCVNTIWFVLLHFEAQNFEDARKHLQKAFDRYTEADSKVTEFHQRHKGVHRHAV